MKSSISIVLFLIIPAMAVAQKHIDYDFFPYESSVNTIKFKVLDINFDKKLVAFKHIYELQPVFTIDYERNPVDCKYAGMESNPYAGVVLGIYDLEKGAYLKTFTIYESCIEIMDCYDHELSAKKLDSAKQLFKDYNLDIDKKPKALLFKKQSKDSYTLNVNGINFSSSYINDYDNQKSISYLYADEKLLYYTEHDDNFVMASNAVIFYRAAYRSGEKIVFLNKYFHTNNMEGPKSYEYHYFSPVFQIKGNYIVLDKN